MERGGSRSTDRLELARQRVVAAFAAHWRGIVQSRKDVAKERADSFFADSSATREQMARSFYGREHASQMAALSTAEVREMLAPWLERAVQHWRDQFDEIDDSKGDDFLTKLPTAEYVSIIHKHSGFAGGILIDRYPGEGVNYDDLYERMLSGFSTGGVLRLYKSTGERFTQSEARSVRAAIRQDLLSGIEDAGDEDSWVVDMQAEGKWETAQFEGEDLQRVVIVEVNDSGEGGESI